MSRRLKEGILNAFCKYAEGTEIPTIFSLWSAIAAISAIFGRDCFVDRGYFTVYPNLYIVIVAGSAVCKKSSAIMMGYKAMKEACPNMHILSQKITPEALIGSLSGMTAETSTLLVEEACGVLVADELATLIDKNAFKSGMITVLTKLYDCEDFPYETKGRGLELVKNPCVTMLGGMTMKGLKDSIPQEAIGGGFTSRVIFIFQKSNTKSQPWPMMTSENRKRHEDIVHDLREVEKLRGGFALTNEALSIFKDEYARFRSKTHLLNNPNFDGYVGRRDTNLLKICMVLSASFNDSKVIDEAVMSESIKLLTVVEKDMPRVLQAINTEYCGDVCEQTLAIIMNKGLVVRSELVYTMRHRLTVRQLDMIIDTLVESRVVEVVKDGNNTLYKFIG